MLTRIIIATALFVTIKCCDGQLPILPFAPSGSAARWLPNTPTNTLLFQFDLLPNNGLKTGASGTGITPGDNNGWASWQNVVTAGYASCDALKSNRFFVLGGGNAGTSPRCQMTNRVIASMTGTPPTNFTAVIVASAINAATASQELLGSALGSDQPFIDFNANKLTMNAGTPISGAATIQNNKFYTITWIQQGATSEIDTNNVLYVSGNSGTIGLTSGGLYMTQPRVNQFNGNVCRIWLWTNRLNSVDLTAAVNQCQTDFP